MAEGEAKQRAVIGIDLGSADSYVGFISKGTVEIVQNEVSQRKTPSLVGFTDRERLLGDQALSQIKSNVKNTCRNFKHLLGETYGSPGVEVEHFWSTAPIVKDESAGSVGFSVSHRGEPKTFSASAVTAMFLTKLKDITEKWSGMEVEEAVIGVPSYFADFARTALLDAARIAGLKTLRLMNEHTATALEYGYWRSLSFDVDKPHTVAFCMMGHTVFSVAIVKFVKGKLIVVCEKSAKVGGRDMDECLMRTFSEQFKKQTGCDVLSNKKALFKLEDAVTKTKKILSANSESSISCECLMEDHDFSGRIDRSDFLDTCKPMMAKVANVLAAAIKSCGIPVSSIDVVEMCGGSSRVPWVKEMCSKAFGGKDLSMTMNADECVARGCTIMAAILSDSYKAREFKVEDAAVWPVSLSWQMPSIPAQAAQEEAKEKSAVIFPQNSLMNLTKVLSFFRSSSFELHATYAGDANQDLPQELPRRLGTYRVELPDLPEKKKVKVRASLTLHGTFEVTSAHLMDDAVAEQRGVEDVDTDGGSKAESGNGGVKRKSTGGQEGRRCLRRVELAVKPLNAPGLTPEQLALSRQAEERMIQESRDIEETHAKRNDLESYILTMRNSIERDGKLSAFLDDTSRTSLLDQLMKMEDWLYDNQDEPRQVYIDKLAELKETGSRIERRRHNEEKRPEAIAALKSKMLEVKTAAAKAKAKNVAAQQLRSLLLAHESAERWLLEMAAKQQALARHQDPILEVSALEARLEDLSKVALATLPTLFSASGDSGGDDEVTITADFEIIGPPPVTISETVTVDLD
mmetsp:Transcript_81067/g.169278  ORF Transcript_81067/g.169278 Transcript_81067/m.169278 type:complete len:802 (-) Transcript_81067:353-2758(-)